MNTKPIARRMLAGQWRLGLAALALLVSGPVLADTYNIIFKAGGVVQPCATGSFVATKTGAPPPYTVFATAFGGTPVRFNGTVAQPCFGATGAPNFTQGITSLQVGIVNVAHGGQQIPTTRTLSGTLSINSGGNPSRFLTFNPDGTFQFTGTNTIGGPIPAASGTYFLFNEANRIPEPSSLWLVAGSLGALGAVGYRRRRSRRH